MSGQITHLFLKREHGRPTESVSQTQAVAGQGLLGDLQFGVKKRQILLIETETLTAFELAPGQLRENITVAGIGLSGLPAGSRLQLGPAVLEVTGDCAPCQFVDDLRPGLRPEIAGKRGTLCRVISGGLIRVGDDLAIISQPD
jgi:MOSC domain-containing protein YiiM